MVKRKTKNKKTWLTNPKNRPHIFLVALIFLGGGFFAYQSYAKWQDKNKFKQAQASINELYSEIVAKVGQPDNYQKTNSCSRPNLKFEQGPLSCDVDIDFIFGVKNESEALNLFKNIQNTIKARSDLFVQDGRLETNIPSVLVASDIYRIARDEYKSSGGVRCVAVYTYNTPSETYLKLTKDIGKQTFYVTIGCNGNAKYEYY